jgi:hypothetical protein
MTVKRLIGSGQNQVSMNRDLGTMAFQDAASIVLSPQASATPAGTGDMVFQLTDNTTLVIKVKGTDGTVRSTTLTLS